MDCANTPRLTAWIIVFVVICGGTARAQLWAYDFALGPGHGSLSDNFGRIPADDVKIPSLYEAAAGHTWAVKVSRRIGRRTRLGTDLSAWSRNGRGAASPNQILGAITLTWSARLGLELTGGVGMGLARVTYLEQGLESTMFDHGMGVTAALGWRHSLWRGLSITPRLQWFGFAGKEIRVWARSSSLLLGVSWSPKESS